MTEEERQMLIQFVGNVYGETRKVDQNIVNQSGNLRTASDNVKQVFQQVLVQNRPPAPPPQPVFVPPPEPQQVEMVIPAIQAPAPERMYAPQQVNQPTGVNDKILVEISEKLDTIISILKENQNVSQPKKTRTRKVS
ncbi:hypothetical protein EBU95_18795, partial [bacterium]|nr:hypothetical protein [bacterium]